MSSKYLSVHFITIERSIQTSKYLWKWLSLEMTHLFKLKYLKKIGALMIGNHKLCDQSYLYLLGWSGGSRWMYSEVENILQWNASVFYNWKCLGFISQILLCNSFSISRNVWNMFRDKQYFDTRQFRCSSSFCDFFKQQFCKLC